HMSIHDLDGPEPFSGYGVGPFPLYPAQRVQFQVFQDDESFYAGTPVQVVIRANGTERRLTTTTDADGNVVIDGLHPVSNSEVVFYMLDGSQTAFYVTVTPSGDETQYVEVRNFGV
ncbi:MAG: hypothetical protein JNM38_23260, partial [Acidobacteria bacterium]|nr:hypothetical protein [Acidobacteriota bacterium]